MSKYAKQRQQRQRGKIAHQVKGISRSFLDGDITVMERLLSARKVQEAVVAEGLKYRDRLFPPLVTLWMFLLQVLDANGSCRAAVMRHIAWLSACGPASRMPRGAGTGPYCKARQRLSQNLVSGLLRQSGQALQRQTSALAKTILGSRPIKLIDGSVCSMSDTPANQKQWPQPSTQKPGLGFPMVRLVVIISLNCAAVLDVAIGAYAGKQQGESSLFRTLLGSLEAGDIALADRYYTSYWMIGLLLERGVDCVFRQHQFRRIDFRSGRSLGKDDHIITLTKPTQRPKWMDLATYQRLAQSLEVREVRVRVYQRGFRVQSLVVVTTLLNANVYSREEIAEAYRQRWHAELDLRAIKQTMGMDVLRCKTPAMVQKEIWMHLLAYNLIRTLMAQAAQSAEIQPREVSFAGAVQAINAFAPVLQGVAPDHVPEVWEVLLWTIASYRVGNRPGRYEPRAVKRRPKPLALMTVPRQQARNQLARRAIAA